MKIFKKMVLFKTTSNEPNHQWKWRVAFLNRLIDFLKVLARIFMLLLELSKTFRS